MGMELVVAFLAGILALLGGLVAGYYIGRPPRTEKAPGIIGMITDHLGIKL